MSKSQRGKEEGSGGDAGSDPRKTASVVLRHTLADAAAHLDWMIERAEDEAGLITFRLAAGADLSTPGDLRAERIGDHRRDYLTYEGAVSAARGRVDRVARYGIVELAESESHLRVVLEQTGGGGRMKWTGEQEIGRHWKFVGVVC